MHGAGARSLPRAPREIEINIFTGRGIHRSLEVQSARSLTFVSTARTGATHWLFRPHTTRHEGHAGEAVPEAPPLLQNRLWDLCSVQGMFVTEDVETTS